MPRYKLFILKVPLNTNRTTVHSLLRPSINDLPKTTIYHEIQETDIFVMTYVMTSAVVKSSSLMWPVSDAPVTEKFAEYTHKLLDKRVIKVTKDKQIAQWHNDHIS